ncbi:hypothetical protein CJ030_MR4G023940 [Morella rubra]|nr:hypothetical protein CJ030_MR4G023940 [Morella rubra]
MTDWNSIIGKTSGFRGSPTKDEDFEEEDVWSSVNEREDSSSKMRKSKDHSSGSSSAWRLPSAPRIIPRVNTPTTSRETKVARRSSAPVDIPDWSKIYGKSAKMGSRPDASWVDEGDGNSNGAAYGDGDYQGAGDYDDDDEEDGDMVPPHEWIARKLARSQISSFSVCEGAGRTLKGRDLSKVRNAVLTKTGFLE